MGPKVRMRDAEKFMPAEKWVEGSYPFVELADEIATYVTMLDPTIDAQELLRASADVKEHDDASLRNIQLGTGRWEEFPNAGAIAKVLHAVLLKSTKGDAHTMVKGAGTGQGLVAWSRLSKEFAPKTTTDRAALMSQIMNPPRSRNLQELRHEMV